MTGLAVTPISTTEAVVVSLREKILDGAIEPGAPLPEADLTREFGVARPTVRAAWTSTRTGTRGHVMPNARVSQAAAESPCWTSNGRTAAIHARFDASCRGHHAARYAGAACSSARAMAESTPATPLGDC